MSRIPLTTMDFLGIEMVKHAAGGGSGGGEATIGSDQEGTGGKFSGIGTCKPLGQCSLRNQPSESRDHHSGISMAFPPARPNQQTMQRAACFADSSDRRSPKSGNTTAQLTIFYAGTVNVYDVPADKAKAIMALASSGNDIGSPQMTRSAVNLSHQPAIPSSPMGSTSASPRTEMPKQFPMAGTVPGSPGAAYNELRGTQPDQLPLSRKLSLKRFLEKRKDRLSSRSPYHCAAIKPSPQLTLSPTENNW